MYRRFALAFLLFLSELAAKTPCEDLVKLALKNVTIAIAASVEGGRANAPVISFCSVAASLKPSADSDIKVELWLPENSWNGKYMAVGNGGWSGAINRVSMAEAIGRGYATSSTDTGHSGGSGSFALGHPEKLIDFAYRSEHEMALFSKAVIQAFYGQAARLSYWKGCSAGGKQGLKEAQMYPEDFDGVVAGAPAANWTGRAAQAMWVAQALHLDEASYIPRTKYSAIHKAVLDACDAADGVKDGVIENPRACKFDPKTIQCTDIDGTECLTAAQVVAARKLYSSSINPRTGKALYSGLEPGSEMGWETWGGPSPMGIGLDYFRYVLFENPRWDFRTLDFDRDIARAEALDSKRLNATDPNLTPFFARGGKLIQYHGWNDPQISPGNSVAYYQSVVDKLGEKTVEDSYRLFMVPGMAHCGGGEGPNSFDVVTALEEWREGKQAPERVIASRFQATQLLRSRPLCPYPQTAVYSGSGSTDRAANFVCR